VIRLAQFTAALALTLLVVTVAVQFGKLQPPRQLAHGGRQ
jgi:hypothetical protein